MDICPKIDQNVYLKSLIDDFVNFRDFESLKSSSVADKIIKYVEVYLKRVLSEVHKEVKK